MTTNHEVKTITFSTAGEGKGFEIKLSYLKESSYGLKKHDHDKLQKLILNSNLKQVLFHCNNL